MKAILFCTLLLSATVLSGLDVFAQTSSNPIPNKVMANIYWDIQKQMSFSSINEKASLLWTPKVIELQSLEAESLPYSIYTPQENLFRLTFDVGMGHNMDDSIVRWRKCDVAISQVVMSRTKSSWGKPLLSCDSPTAL